MTSKITLITPPDFYENSNISILFIGLSEADQELVSKWLSENVDKNIPDINIYFYQGEDNIPWLLYASARSNVVFLDYDSNLPIVNLMGSYILSQSDSYYKTSNSNIIELISHINNKAVPGVTHFLDMVFNDQAG